MAKRALLSIVLVTLIHYVVAFAVYGTFSTIIGLTLPEGVSPLRFLLSVLVIKIGTAAGFVLLFLLARNALSGRWLAYALLWWLMFAVVEIGQAMGPNYDWVSAVAGIISEAVYFPLSAYVVDRLLRLREENLA